MNRLHAFIIAVAVGLVAIVGGFAAVRTTHLAAAASRVPDSVIAQRTRQLDLYQAQLQARLQGRPLPNAQNVSYVNREGGHDD